MFSLSLGLDLWFIIFYLHIPFQYALCKCLIVTVKKLGENITNYYACKY